MRLIAIPILLLLFVPSASYSAESPADTLCFEVPNAKGWFAGWYGGPNDQLFVDSTTVHGGRYAARLQRHAKSESKEAAAMRVVAVNFTGKFIELRGWIKSQVTDGFVGLWMAEDSREKPGVQFDNMSKRPVVGTTEWTEYRIVLPLDPTASSIRFGAHLWGHGTVWFDDVQLLVDGKPVYETKTIKKATKP